MPVRDQGSRCLTIDTSVLRSAGGTEAGRGKSCRDLLLAILDICHRAIMTPALGEEWRRHRSNFSRKWLVLMSGKKKLVRSSPSGTFEAIQSRLDAHVAGTSHEHEASKDFLLLEAACDSDRVIISLDEKARGHFKSLANTIGEIRSIAWVNPEQENAVAWLEAGAPTEPKRLLGASQES
jgi:hypothetical protein